MLLIQRETDIVSLVNQQGSISVRELADLFNVTEVTIRRDLNRLESLGLLRRVRGGALKANSAPTQNDVSDLLLDDRGPDFEADALILAPVQNRAAHTLRERALRSGIPLIAESIPLEGAVYLGPRNFEASQKLGEWTAAYLRANMPGTPVVLDISQNLPNTKERSDGFADGLKKGLGQVRILSINGHGLYSDAYAAASNALRAHPDINVIFGINDDSVLAGIHAYLDLERDPAELVAVNVGGEGKTLLDYLARRGPLKACAALFPEPVGYRAIDACIRLWSGQEIGAAIYTPSAILTADNLTTYYTLKNHQWEPDFEAIARLEGSSWPIVLPKAPGKRISFVILYRTHEWYQSLAAAMDEAATKAGITLTVNDVNQDLQIEINELRRLIGKAAASYVNDGEVVILDTGTATNSMAGFLDDRRDLTVITNSLPIFRRLQQNPDAKVILTGGELYQESQALVGRSAALTFQEIRAHKAFITASGISLNFGVSCPNQPEAEIRQTMVNSAREVTLLVDHTALGVDSNVKLVDLNRIDTLITDSGALPSQLLEFQQRGIKVIIAGQIPQTDSQTSRH